uniref:Glycoside hydrolase family 2 catalytic domain-containing protein n=1 Tax=Sphaeramia orbicularis TaxID=375764 RepID=A0A673AUR8_9TELE
MSAVSTSGFVSYVVSVGGASTSTVKVTLMDKDGQCVASSTGLTGVLKVVDVNLWWPYLMPEPGLPVLHGGEAAPQSHDSGPIQRRLPSEICIRGKGLDWPLMVKDFNLLKWLGANSFRTSHYPYAEEILQMSDRHGIVVIDECPGVGIKDM